MKQHQDRWLLAWFAGYFIVVCGLFVGLPRLLNDPYLMPHNYWPLFLIITPMIAVGILGLSNRFGGLAVLMFYLAAVALGLFLGWFSHWLAAGIT